MPNARLRVLLAAALMLTLSACGSDSDTPNDGDGSGEADAGHGADAAMADAATDATAGEDAAPLPTPELPTFDGECAAFDGDSFTMTVAERERTGNVYLPDEPAGAPLLVLYHGLGDNPSNFGRAFGAQSIADSEGAIVVMPAGTGENSIVWPFLAGDEAEVDYALLDALVVCLEGAYDIDERRIYVGGFSAGALWSTHLTAYYDDYIAAAVIFSGGTNENIVPYAPGTREVPVLTSHGGPEDQVVTFKFFEMVEEMVTLREAEDHLSVLCTHNQGHTVTQDIYTAGIDFVFDHEFGKRSSYRGALTLLPPSCTVR